MIDLAYYREEKAKNLVRIRKINKKAFTTVFLRLLTKLPKDFSKEPLKYLKEYLWPFVIFRIIQRLQEENNILAKTDITYAEAAWALRNVMDIRVFTKFVCLSQTNLERFANDTTITITTTSENVLALIEHLNRLSNSKEGLGLGPYKALEELKKLRDADKLTHEAPLKVRSCARLARMEKDYLTIGSITSALIHPSSQSVLKVYDYQIYEFLFAPFGLSLIAMTLLDISKHIKTYGLNPEK
jgi:hypothetical protein